MLRPTRSLQTPPYLGRGAEPVRGLPEHVYVGGRRANPGMWGVPRTKPSGRHGQALEEKLLGARRAVGEETLRAPRARVLRRSRTLWLSGGRKWCRKPVLAPALRAPWWHALLSGSTAQWRCQDRGFLDHAHRNVSCYLLAGQESRRVLG